MIDVIVNDYRLANTYVVELNNQQDALIDVGGPSIDSLLNWLASKEKTIAAVFLTHEHADHCVGLLQKERLGDFPIYCSTVCANNIANKRLNFSLYSDDIETFEIAIDYTPVEDWETIEMVGHTFKVFHTPGHSPGSICILLNGEHFFSGDTILNGVKTLLTLPSSNKAAYRTSLTSVDKFLPLGSVIYPGHGERFNYTGALVAQILDQN